METAENRPNPESEPNAAEPDPRLEQLDAQMAHVWMVRTFLKHCDEVEEDEELQSVVRDLYDVLLAVGPAAAEGDVTAYLKMLKKKRRRLVRASELFDEIQPEVSGHTSFVMAARSLRTATATIVALTQ